VAEPAAATDHAFRASTEVSLEPFVGVDAERPLGAVPGRRLDERAMVRHLVPVRPVGRDAQELDDVRARGEVLGGAVGGAVVECNDPVDVRSDVGEVAREKSHPIAYRQQREQPNSPPSRQARATRRDHPKPGFEHAHPPMFAGAFVRE
jgi:hypothetical protein